MRRIDVGAIAKPELLPNGWLKVLARPTRAGVFVYRDQTGKAFRELRPPSEVFDPESLASLQLVPVTNDHPPEQLDAVNIKRYQVGNVGDSVSPEQPFVVAPLIVQERRAIDSVLSGKSQLSCGYDADLDETPGVYDGVPYDAIQRRIRYNHVAIVDIGRAGPDCRIRLDAAGKAAEELLPMETCMIGGKSYTLTPEQRTQFEQLLNTLGVSEDAAQGKNPDEPLSAGAPPSGCDQIDLCGKKMDRAQVERIVAEYSAVKARLDSIASEAAQKAQRAKIEREVRARLSLESVAAQHAVKCDGLSDDDVRRAVLAKVAPGVDLAGKDSVYLTARLDCEIERLADTAVGAARGEVPAKHVDSAETVDPDKARETFLAEQAKRGSSPRK